MPDEEEHFILLTRSSSLEGKAFFSLSNPLTETFDGLSSC